MLNPTKHAESVCIRCGKQRIFSKRWKEKVDGKGTTITSVEAVCPDKECQKLVDEKFAEMRERRMLAEQKKKKPVVKTDVETTAKI